MSYDRKNEKILANNRSNPAVFGGIWGNVGRQDGIGICRLVRNQDLSGSGRYIGKDFRFVFLFHCGSRNLWTGSADNILWNPSYQKAVAFDKKRVVSGVLPLLSVCGRVRDQLFQNAVFPGNWFRYQGLF